VNGLDVIEHLTLGIFDQLNERKLVEGDVKDTLLLFAEA